MCLCGILNLHNHRSGIKCSYRMFYIWIHIAPLLPVNNQFTIVTKPFTNSLSWYLNVHFTMYRKFKYKKNIVKWHSGSISINVWLIALILGAITFGFFFVCSNLLLQICLHFLLTDSLFWWWCLIDCRNENHQCYIEPMMPSSEQQ